MKHTMIRVLAVCVLAVSTAACDKACNTAERMADKTVFNADKNVWSYEQFHQRNAQFEQYRGQLADAEKRLSDLRQRNVSAGQEYDNLVTEISGIRQMMRRIAADYNTASDIWYQDVWRSKDLPKRLDP